MDEPRYRVGGHWRVTVVEVGDGPAEDLNGIRREGDRLMACAQTAADAQRIVDALNRMESTA